MKMYFGKNNFIFAYFAIKTGFTNNFLNMLHYRTAQNFNLTQFDNQLQKVGRCLCPVGFRGLPGLNTAFAIHFEHSHHQTNFLSILHYRTAQNFNFNTV